MDFDKIMLILSGHWPFLAVAFILGVIGEVFKGIILGKKEDTEKTGRLVQLYKKTLPLHPIVTGALLGLALSATIPDVVVTGGVISSMLYFALSGALSSSIYNLLKSLRPQIANAIRNKIATISGAKPDSTQDPPDGV